MDANTKDESQKALQQSRDALLIVEDDFRIRQSLAAFFLNEDFDVFEAASVDEAKGILLTQSRVDLVLSDMQLPAAGDGMVLANWILHAFPTLPVILMSASSAALNDAVFKCRNATAFLQKPVKEELALQRVRLALAMRPIV